MRREGIIAVTCAALFAACVENPLVICGNGRACPVGLMCDLVHDACVQPSQLQACAGQIDGARCSYAGVASGTCAGGVCFPAVCGGGFLDADEECDDGNRISGDGCSADCAREECGNGRVDINEACDDGDLMSHDGCDSSCSPEQPNWHQLALVPINYRLLPALAHDAIRRRTVVFSGSSAAIANDTWEWYGHTWTSLASVSGPTTRLAASTAYDATRQELVMFGGLINGSMSANDTWGYDGVRWRELTPALSPPPRSRGALTYDAGRRRIVLFGGHRGGVFNDTWEWDGVTWIDLTPATRPSQRIPTTFAYDPVRGTSLLVGGYNAAGDPLVNDTWSWDGTSWTQLTPATTPAGTPLTMAFDVASGRMVFLAHEGNQILWWEWDGVDWSADPTKNLIELADGSVMFYDHGLARLVVFALLSGDQLSMLELGPSGWETAPAPTEPPARDGTAMTYDPTRGLVMLFGGRDAAPALLGDLWAWDGSRWQPRSPSGSAPEPRHAHAMVYDLARGELIVVGGRTAAGRTGETWAWNGTSWRLAGAMPPLEQLALVYDPRLRRVVAFGGIARGFDGFDHHVAETWQWDGTTWTEIAIGAGPLARTGHGMVYDARRDRIVMFGGASEYQTFSDLWELDGATWQQRTATLIPPRRSGHAMAYDANRGTAVIVGGRTAALDGAQPLGDTWEWDGTSWMPIATFATPSRGFDRVAAYHAGSARMVMFGGAVSETWIYGYDGELRAEVCGGGHDVDGDGLIGCDDPDCWWRCSMACPPGTTCEPAMPRCGDGACAALEDCRLCPSDCGACPAQCGDLACDPGETCPGDCAP